MRRSASSAAPRAIIAMLALALLLSGCASVCEQLLDGRWDARGARCDDWLLELSIPL